MVKREDRDLVEGLLRHESAARDGIQNRVHAADHADHISVECQSPVGADLEEAGAIRVEERDQEFVAGGQEHDRARPAGRSRHRVGLVDLRLRNLPARSNGVPGHETG